MRSSGPIDAVNAASDDRLPVEDVLGALKVALSDNNSAVLIAPPGAGKTTLVPGALLDAGWLRGQQILLLLPRRLAVRAAAERISELLGEKVGRRVGYRTRLESKVGPDARIECVTYGVFVNRIIGEPEMAGVGALLFDEIHERSLDADLALALAIDGQGGLRPDLRLLAMSATVDGARFSALLGGAPVIESAGRQFPLAVHHLGRPASGVRLEDAMARGIERAMRSAPGSLLAFLPGVAEIDRVADALRVDADVVVHRLHGAADPVDQRRALARGPGRKCVLATGIAETSLTIDGVTMVVDSGLARRPRFDPATGFTRLATVRVSQATAVQRAGRAGRQAPGQVWRLWDAAETAGLAPYDAPEIAEADLMPLVLRLAAWGVRDPAALRWLDPPPHGPWAAARARLAGLGAIDADGRLTAHGRRVQQLPVSPPLAHMLLEAAGRGQGADAATLAILIEERGLGGSSADIAERYRRFAGERGSRAEAARGVARRWAELAARLARADSGAPLAGGGGPPPGPAGLLALAFPDRVARRRRAATGADRTAAYLMAGGRGALVDAADPLAAAEWLLVADAGGSGADARVRLAAAFSDTEAAAWCLSHATVADATGIDPATGRVVADRVTRLGAIVVARARGARPSADAIAAALMAVVARDGLDVLPWTGADRALRARLAFAAAHGLAGVPAMDDESLLADTAAEVWMRPCLRRVDRLADVVLDDGLLQLLDWSARAALDRFAPPRFETPAGTRHDIDYAGPVGPTVTVRVQALFGLNVHPAVAGGAVPLVMALTSPAGRPLALTRDLAAFWAGGWRDVQREMKGRYPRHPWPDDPAAASPTSRTKAADRRMQR